MSTVAKAAAVRLPSKVIVSKKPIVRSDDDVGYLDDEALSLVLSGSGAKYPVHLGVVLYLLTKWHKLTKKKQKRLKRIAGISGGSLMGALLATGQPVEDVINIVSAINPSRYLDSNIMTPEVVTWPFNAKGVYAGDEILALLRDIFGGKKMGDLPVEFHVGTYNIQRGRLMIWGNQPINHPSAVYAPDREVALLVRASMSLPLVFDPVPLRYDQLVGGRVVEDLHLDGGLGSNFPLDIFGDSNRVVGVRFAPQDHLVARPMKTKLDIVMASLDAMIDATMKKHIEDALHARQVYVKTAHDGMDFNLTYEKIMKMIDDGEACAKVWAEKEEGSK